MRMASFVQALSGFTKVHVACIAQQLPSETVLWAHDLGVTIEGFNRPLLTRSRIWRERITMLLTRCNLLHRTEEQAFFNKVFKRLSPDLIWMETPYLLRYALQWKDKIPIVVDYWGTSEGRRRILANTRGPLKIWRWWQWNEAKGGELRYAPQIRDIVCVSRLDGQYFERIAPNSRVWPIPNGIIKNSKLFGDSINVKKDLSTMILTGDLSYLPNVDSSMYFVKEIFPLIRGECPEARIRLIGRSPGPEILALNEYPGVKVSGYVPDLAEEIAKSVLYVLPMRLGSGIRSKLFDVFPLGIPIVSTTIGAEGLELYHRENCLIADSKTDFAKACIRLLKDRKELERLGNAVRRLATETYSQDNVSLMIRRTVEEILKNKEVD